MTEKEKLEQDLVNTKANIETHQYWVDFFTKEVERINRDLEKIAKKIPIPLYHPGQYFIRKSSIGKDILFLVATTRCTISLISVENGWRCNDPKPVADIYNITEQELNSCIGYGTLKLVSKPYLEWGDC